MRRVLLLQSIEELLKSSDLLNKEVENILVVNNQGINMFKELSIQSEKTKNSNVEVEQAIVKLDKSTESIYEILESTRGESKNTVSIMKNVKSIYIEQEKAVENVSISFEQISNSIEKSISRIVETINYRPCAKFAKKTVRI